MCRPRSAAKSKEEAACLASTQGSDGPKLEGETLAECIAEYQRAKTDWKLDDAQYQAFLDCEIAAKSEADSFMCSVEAMKHHQQAISEDAYQRYMAEGETGASANEPSPRP